MRGAAPVNSDASSLFPICLCTAETFKQQLPTDLNASWINRMLSRRTVAGGLTRRDGTQDEQERERRGVEESLFHLDLRVYGLARGRLRPIAAEMESNTTGRSTDRILLTDLRGRQSITPVVKDLAIWFRICLPTTGNTQRTGDQSRALGIELNHALVHFAVGD
jgi:hypothetical protein